MADQVRLLALLAGVRVDQDVVGPRTGADAAQQVKGGGEHESRRIRVTQAPVSLLVPGVGQPIVVAQCNGSRFEQSRRDPVTAVHQGFAAGVADARLERRFEQRVRVVNGAHVQDGRRPAQQQLGDAQPRRCAHRLWIVGGFERPDAFAQPGQQWLVLGQAAE